MSVQPHPQPTAGGGVSKLVIGRLIISGIPPPPSPQWGGGGTVYHLCGGGEGTSETGTYMFQCPVIQAPSPPPANAMSIQGGLGQATRYLVFPLEIKAKPVWGLV